MSMQESAALSEISGFDWLMGVRKLMIGLRYARRLLPGILLLSPLRTPKSKLGGSVGKLRIAEAETARAR
jgi:hypothetical protein